MIPGTDEAVTPGEFEVTCVLCTIRKAVVYMLTVTSSVDWARFTAKVTGPPVEGLGYTTGVVTGKGVELGVGVTVAWFSVSVAPDTGMGLNCVAWPLTFPAAPVTLKV